MGLRRRPTVRRPLAQGISVHVSHRCSGSLSLKQSLLYGASCAIGGDLAHTALASSTRFVELGAAAWSNNTVRVVAGNVSLATFDLGAATLSVQVTKRRVP